MFQQPLKYFAYCRKSSEAEDRQVLSIDGQITELEQLAKGNGLSILEILTEAKSAKEKGREIFEEMIARIEKGEANAILTWKLDRLARNFDDGGRIISLLQRGTIQEIRTFERTHLPSDNVLVIAVELGMANQYVRDLSFNVRRGIREKVRRGIFPGKAPLGYMNDRSTHTLEPHPSNFHKVKRVLELFATGGYSPSGIKQELTDAGLSGSQTGKPLSFSSIERLLRNPFYYGLFVHNGELHEGTHVPMISKQTFDQIQKAIASHRRSRRRKGEDEFVFRNFATCASCGYSITAERHIKKTGRTFSYYRCTHKNPRRRCENRGYITENELVEEVKRNVRLVSLPENVKRDFLAEVKKWESEMFDDAETCIVQLRSELDTVKSTINRLNAGFSGGGFSFDELKELKNPLMKHKLELEQQITSFQKNRVARLEPLKAWIHKANDAEKLANSENLVEMKKFLQAVGSNRRLSGKRLTVSFKKPWDYLAETVVAVGKAKTEQERNSIWRGHFTYSRTFVGDRFVVTRPNLAVRL